MHDVTRLSLRPWSIVGCIAAASFAYAAIRYVVLGPVAAAQLPLYVTNKALSLASLLCLALAIVAGRRTRREPSEHPLHPRRLGQAALAFATLHAVASLLLLRPSYFAAWFDERGLLLGRIEAAMLVGGVAWLLLLRLGRAFRLAEFANARERETSHRSQLDAGDTARNAVQGKGFGTIILLLIAAHSALIGAHGWFEPARWHGGMPPITLLACVAAVLALVVRRR